jgi:hypothetical protein
MLPMKQVLSQIAKVPAPGMSIAKQLMTRSQSRAVLVSDTDIAAAIYKEATDIIADAMLLVPDMMP